VIGDEVFSNLYILVSELHLKLVDVLEIELLDGDSLIDFSLLFNSVFSAK
jgi:hypothetical protein